jgi:alpha-amylase/alpha-mannosidase (GH57 family)
MAPGPDGGLALVIHGHFYQPPRENPWTGEVPQEAGAEPFHDWNERITAESYGPNAAVEVTQPDGRREVVSTYEHLSFNMGPTLLSWLEQHQPDVYAAVLAADRRAGRAVAQGYNHAILPLCNDRDLRTQIRWGVADFRHRFGRTPEGMWLPETAVSERVLAVLAEEGLRFTILAPSQLRAIRPLGADDGWHDLLDAVGQSTGPLAIDRPYHWQHPARPDLGLELVVYDGGLAHRLAFSEPTSAAIVAMAVEHGTVGGMVAAATDGETFGHHHRGAERVLAQALAVDGPAIGVRVPRLVDLLDELPPTHQARVRTSAWSCAHGVGRWMNDCGCHTGGHEGWTQMWRAPLRAALDLLRDWGVDVMERRGPKLLHDPWLARDAYVNVLVGARTLDDFAQEHIIGDRGDAVALLEAQRMALLMYTSCGWFFNDLAGLETVQILRYAACAMDRYRDLGEEPPVDVFLAELARATSNDPAAGDGRRIWIEQVDTSRPDPAI